MTHSEREQLLRGTTHFAGCSDGALRELSMLVDEVCIPAGTLLAEQGRLCHELVIVVSGVLETCRAGRTGLFGRGSTFGWNAMRDRAVHEASVRAATPATLLVMSHLQFGTAAAIAAENGCAPSDSRDYPGMSLRRNADSPDYPRSSAALPFAGPPSPAGPSPAGSPAASVSAQKTHANPGC